MLQRDIGTYIKVQKGIDVQNASAGTINGAGVSRIGLLSAVLHANCGAASGAPSAQTVDAKLQHSPDNSTWADANDRDGNLIAITQLTADNTENYKDADLSGLDEYIRVVTTVGFTGGTSPAIPVSSTIVLGGSDKAPLA